MLILANVRNKQQIFVNRLFYLKQTYDYDNILSFSNFPKQRRKRDRSTNESRSFECEI